MNFVEPIRDADIFHDIQATLKKENPRNYALVMTGTYTGLRISDILRLKVKDVKNKKYIDIREKKTGKRNLIEINQTLRNVYKEYCLDMSQEDYLFRKSNLNKPISRTMAWKIMKDIGDKFGVENLGTHTLRKTFGFHYYKKTGDIATLMQMYNHSKESITLKYIGITQDKMNQARRDFEI
ncbi:site-specific integrase [Clostridium botulinum]|uniref:site-specific integrase n=1 Tax=Clostridium botulinum TaxID=1491 RepID=UPI0005408207|nr:site-specific integrase [Clostridium botulinum]AIY80991.1 phage integrase family protein [Clostridium botulinum 202F]KAI3346968.1 site-specific integrase [Clostridium botulinum]KIL06606.1 integrase [Clostridium botulinum]KON13695.1 integrase [Clostridium botulinum]MBY6934529.1 site-specific integrase [Clostridium botulinum]